MNEERKIIGGGTNVRASSEERGYEVVNWCEFDKYAATSYIAIHNEPEEKNLGDITKVDETKLKTFNMICGGSPCQDFSVAGKQAGSKWRCNDCGEEYNPLVVHYSKRHMCPKCCSKNLDKTRSSLLVEWLRIIRANKPAWGVYENVKNIIGKHFRETFDLFINELHEYGYNTYYKVLNAKDYGVPQNRERIYLIIILKEFDNGKFRFPEKIYNNKKFKDILEDNVDEKYYVNTPKSKELIENLIRCGKLNNNDTKSITGIFSKQCSQLDKETSIANTLLARDYKGFGNQGMNGVLECRNVVRLGNIYNKNLGTSYAGNVWDKNGLSPTLTTMQGGGRQPMVVDDLEDSSKLEYKIRRLTPKECFRLMGFSDEDFDKAKNAGISNTQLYKQAGNSIVVDVLYYIFVNVYVSMPYLFDNLKVGSYFSGIGAFEKALDKTFELINKNHAS